MQKSHFRRFFQGAALAATVAVANAAVPSVAIAQVQGDARTAQTTTNNDRNDGFNLGWLGLIGLAGLLGLRRNDKQVHHDTTRR